MRTIEFEDIVRDNLADFIQVNKLSDDEVIDIAFVLELMYNLGVNECEECLDKYASAEPALTSKTKFNFDQYIND